MISNKFLKIILFPFTRVIILYLVTIGLAFLVIDEQEIMEGIRRTTLNRIRPPEERIDHLSKYYIGQEPMDQELVERFEFYYKKIATYLPQRFDAQGMVGFSAYLLNKDKEAMKAYEKAIVVNPRFFWFYHNLGLLYTRDKQYEKAIDVLKKALTLNPNDALTIISTSYRIYGPSAVMKYGTDKDKIKSALLIELMIGHKNVYELLILNYLYTENYQEMHNLSEYAQTQFVNDQGIFNYYQGLALLNMKQYTHAIGFFRKSITEYPNNPEVYNALSIVLGQLGQHEQAEKLKLEARRIRKIQEETLAREWQMEPALY